MTFMLFAESFWGLTICDENAFDKVKSKPVREYCMIFHAVYQIFNIY